MLKPISAFEKYWIQFPEKLFCICQKPYNDDEVMPQCWKCHQWYHGTCIGMPDNELKLYQKDTKQVFCCGQCNPIVADQLSEEDQVKKWEVRSLSDCRITGDEMQNNSETTRIDEMHFPTIKCVCNFDVDPRRSDRYCKCQKCGHFANHKCYGLTYSEMVVADFAFTCVDCETDEAKKEHLMKMTEKEIDESKRKKLAQFVRKILGVCLFRIICLNFFNPLK